MGVFDGVHRGHQCILKAAVRKAKDIKGTSIVVTFWPDPHQEQSLYSLEHRLRLISQIGIDVCVVINFNQNFSRINAEDFVKEILVKKIDTRFLYVGKNFRFGKNGAGDYKTLQRLSRIYGFKLKLFPVIRIKGKVISSTAIRNLICVGELAGAQRLLSRPVSVLGTVIRGDSLGKRLGFPTANIDPHHEVLPPLGIYIVRVIYGKRILKGACYIGTKPTFKGRLPVPACPAGRRQAGKVTFLRQGFAGLSMSPACPCLSGRQAAGRQGHKSKYIEVYIFNFFQNIYGEYLEIQFLKKIREDKKFRTKEALIKQIKKDISFALTYFSRHS